MSKENQPVNKLIVHLTAALGGGVAHSLSQLAKAQANDGYRVIVMYSVRPETPGEQVLHKLFPTPIERSVIDIATQVSLLEDLKNIWRLAKLFRQLDPSVIHLHSSKAGVVGRVAARIVGKQARTFYSPRGFSFLRQDISKSTRWLYVMFEKLATCFGGTLIACSESEADVARRLISPRHLAVVDNSVELENIPPAKGGSGDPIRIATSGRICYQKAPWHVRDIALYLGSKAQFVWIGDGDLKFELESNGKLVENIRITGWMDREGVIEELVSCDIFLLPSLWEGMPLALIEAQAAGLPGVVLDVVGCKDVVSDGVTGFICRDIEELKRRVSQLASDPALRKTLGENARALALERFSVSRMHRKMCITYGLSLGS